MSKMSQLHLTLDEQAVELGFEGLDDALMKGYDVDYEKGKLVKPGLGYSETVKWLTKKQQEAHAEWLKEREEVLKRLNDLYDELVYIGMDDEYLATVNDSIDFIKKGEV